MDNNRDNIYIGYTIGKEYDQKAPIESVLKDGKFDYNRIYGLDDWVDVDNSMQRYHGYVSGAKSILAILGPDTIIGDFDDRDDASIAERIIKSEKLNTRIIKTDKGIHTVWRNADYLVKKNKSRVATACGLIIDHKLGNPKDNGDDRCALECIKKDGKYREIIYDQKNEEGHYDEIPCWLREVTLSDNFDFRGMADGSGRNDVLFRYQNVLASNGFTKDEIIETERIINKYVFAEPLSDVEFAQIIRDDAVNNALANASRTAKKGSGKNKSNNGKHRGTTISEEEHLGKFTDEEIDAMFKDYGIIEQHDFHYVYFKDGHKASAYDEFAAVKYLAKSSNVCKIDRQLYMYTANGIYTSDDNFFNAAVQRMDDTVSPTKWANYLKRYGALLADAPDMGDQAKSSILFKNTCYHVDTDTFDNPSPYDYCRNLIPHNYNPESANTDSAKAIDEELRLLTSDRQEIIELIWEVAGYMMCSDNRGKSIFVIIGPPNGGKSVLVSLYEGMLGKENVSNVPMQRMGERFTNIDIVNKLANIGNDIPKSFVGEKAASMLKSMSGGDRIPVEAKGKPLFSASVYAKHIFTANTMPKISDDSAAVYERLEFIPLNAHFEKENDEHLYLLDKIKTEDAYEYMVYKGIEGLKRYRKNGFTRCQDMLTTKEQLQAQNDSVSMFLNDIDPEKEILLRDAKNIYSDYKSYCDSEGIYATSKKNMCDRIAILMGYKFTRMPTNMALKTILPDGTEKLYRAETFIQK